MVWKTATPHFLEESWRHYGLYGWHLAGPTTASLNQNATFISLLGKDDVIAPFREL